MSVRSDSPPVDIIARIYYRSLNSFSSPRDLYTEIPESYKVYESVHPTHTSYLENLGLSHPIIYDSTMLLNFSLPGAWLLLALPVISLVAWIFYAITLHPLRKIPGPFLARVSYFWYMRRVWTEDVEKDQKRLHEKHGPLILLSPNEVSCSE
jgi:hypothetical protein